MGDRQLPAPGEFDLQELCILSVAYMMFDDSCLALLLRDLIFESLFLSRYVSSSLTISHLNSIDTAVLLLNDEVSYI